MAYTGRGSMQVFKTLALALMTWLAAGSTALADVQLTIHDGLVSLNARDATVRDILAEWERVGQTKILNRERVPGGPVTLQLTDTPEEQALEILLRPFSGYMAAPRRTFSGTASRFDRILVMPTAAAPRPAALPAAQPQPPRFVPPTPVDDQAGDPAFRIPAQPGPAQRPPIFNTFPSPENPQPEPGAAPIAAPPSAVTSTPTAPPGVAVPGIIVQPPPQPGQQVAPPPQRP